MVSVSGLLSSLFSLVEADREQRELERLIAVGDEQAMRSYWSSLQRRSLNRGDAVQWSLDAGIPPSAVIMMLRNEGRKPTASLATAFANRELRPSVEGAVAAVVRAVGDSHSAHRDVVYDAPNTPGTGGWFESAVFTHGTDFGHPVFITFHVSTGRRNMGVYMIDLITNIDDYYLDHWAGTLRRDQGMSRKDAADEVFRRIRAVQQNVKKVRSVLKAEFPKAKISGGGETPTLRVVRQWANQFVSGGGDGALHETMDPQAGACPSRWR